MTKILEIKARLKHYDCWSSLCEIYSCIGRIHHAVKINNNEIMEFTTLKFDDIKFFSNFINIPKKKNIVDILYSRQTYRNNVDIVYILDYNFTIRKLLETLNPLFEEVITINGIEYWKIYSIMRIKTELSSVLSTLKHSLETENIKVLDIRFNLYKFNDIAPYFLPPSLTDHESEILFKAYKEGYFETPRNISLTKLADELGISKAALLKSLRNSIKKLIMNYLRNRAVM
ncbi:helix-turn-helix domain-containing protein [Sulfolobus sp. E11-6]|uniref:helix-turn-helix domain-containing protein n=1 Tax=Sulfolobus sp. E11-6 TaxID=2663020 RepID=UPI001297AAFD|nr:helix-turn-helix domain-containing protein [Sulfolobus sp. E11-6]QGA68111.1 bacterio-opsin activator [Sulfolobus sp. E11-6]